MSWVQGVLWCSGLFSYVFWALGFAVANFATFVAQHWEVFVHYVLPKSTNFDTLGSGLAMLIWTQTLAYLPRIVAVVMASTFKSLPSFCPMCLRNS